MNTLIPTTFIRASEIWVPTADGSMLEFGGGLYREAPRLGAVSAPLCFGRGEGLPGQAWEQGTPVLINQWEGSGFRRTAAAKAAGLRCALAIPIFANEVLRAVVVFFCGSSQTHAGAIELWRNKARVTPDMTLVDGYTARRSASQPARLRPSRARLFCLAVLVFLVWRGSRTLRCSWRT